MVLQQVYDIDAECTNCNGDILGLMKEKTGGWKVYAECRDCDNDFGRLGYVNRSNIGHVDEAYEQAAVKVEEYFK